jgi:hypothetical protein
VQRDIPHNLSNPPEQLSSSKRQIPKAREISRFFRRKISWETIWRRKVSRAANPDKEHTATSPDNPDKVKTADNPHKVNIAASPDKTSRRKVARVRPTQNKTTRTAIVSVALPSFSYGNDH